MRAFATSGQPVPEDVEHGLAVHAHFDRRRPRSGPQPDLIDMRVAQLQIERALVHAEGRGSSLARVAAALPQLRARLSYLTEHSNPG